MTAVEERKCTQSSQSTGVVKTGKRGEKEGVGGWGCSFFCRLSHLTADHASLSKRSTVPTGEVNEKT